jgi:N6-L-threonylcarbamoyladenine synthase
MQTAYDFSFSGLKTAVLRAAQAICGKDYALPSSALPELLSQSQKADLAASFQKTAIETLVEAVRQAEAEFSPKDIVVAGGVAANRQLRKSLISNLITAPIFPDIKLCTDNAAMVAAAGYFRVKTKQKPSDPYSLPIDPSLSMLAQ